jgi:hypothetical protein
MRGVGGRRRRHGVLVCVCPLYCGDTWRRSFGGDGKTYDTKRQPTYRTENTLTDNGILSISALYSLVSQRRYLGFSFTNHRQPWKANRSPKE